jgi:hypothetical protein
MKVVAQHPQVKACFIGEDLASLHWNKDPDNAQFICHLCSPPRLLRCLARNPNPRYSPCKLCKKKYSPAPSACPRTSSDLYNIAAHFESRHHILLDIPCATKAVGTAIQSSKKKRMTRTAASSVEDRCAAKFSEPSELSDFSSRGQQLDHFPIQIPPSVQSLCHLPHHLPHRIIQLAVAAFFFGQEPGQETTPRQAPCEN